MIFSNASLNIADATNAASTAKTVSKSQNEIKAFSDLFKAWTDKSIFSTASANFFKGVGAINGTFVTISVVFSILSAFQEKEEDPVLKMLNETNQKLNSLDSKIDFTTSELQNTIKKQAYANHLNRYTFQYSNIRNSWIDIDIRKFNIQMKKLANNAGVNDNNPNYADPNVMEKIIKYSQTEEGCIELKILDEYMKNIYSNSGSKTVSNLYTDFMNLMDMTDGTSIPISSNYINADIHTIYRTFQSVAKNWTHETFAARKAFLETTIKEIIEIATPLMFSINWDISRNEDIIKNADTHLEKTLAENAITLDNALLKNINDKIARLKISRETEESKLEEEQKQYNDNKTVHNYRTNQTFKRVISRNSTPDEGFDYWHITKTHFQYKTAYFELKGKTWSEQEYETMKYAAKIRSNENPNALAQELKNFIIKGDAVVQNKSKQWIYTPKSEKVINGDSGFSYRKDFYLKNEVVNYGTGEIKNTELIWGWRSYILWGIESGGEIWWWPSQPSIFEKV
ncbi:MAG: hypothetical protein LBB10_01760 [Bifidobacteriaceae bacterium]|nr:hypothetical protein [Bifidobacteriaceae bacterium]